MTAALERQLSTGSGIEARVAAVKLVDDRRSDHPINVLSRKFDGLCTTAVSAHQIAALLEAEGVNDRIAQERYGHPDVFALATDLHDRVPLRRSEEPLSEPDLEGLGTQRSAVALIMRGPIYLAPVLFFVASAGLLRQGQVFWAGLLALLLAWAWNQGVGSLVYHLIGRGNLPGANRLARISLTLGTVTVTSFVWATTATVFGDSSVALFAAGQTAYLIAAATLLTFGHDRLVVFALLPGLTIVSLSFTVSAVSDTAVVAATVCTLALIVGSMIWATRTGQRASIPRMTRFDLSIAGSHALLGAMWALLIALAGLSLVGTADVVTVVSLAAIPMVLTMGVAEWQLLQLRRETRVALMETGDAVEFATRSRRAFLRATVTFASILIAVTVLVGVGMSLAGGLTGAGAMLGVGFVWLGIAFFAGLVLISMERIVIPLSASAYVIVVIAYLLIATSLSPMSSAGLYSIGCLVLCLVLVPAVLAVIPTAVLHR